MLPYKKPFTYSRCKWCHGKGCLHCEPEAKKDSRDQFPNGPEPIATFKIPEEMGLAREAIGREALEKAFGDGGGGVQEIIDNCKRVKGGGDA